MFFYPLTRKGRASRKTAKALYLQIVARAREPVFYTDFAVPDSFTGRFEMIALHAGIVINRVHEEGADGKLLAQAIFDEMFINMDISCRQSGIGDLGVPRHIQRMMTALKGRALVYDQAAKAGRVELAASLNKNLYATVEKPADNISMAMSEYVIACSEKLKQQTMADFMSATVSFAALPQSNGDYNGQASQVA